MLNTLLLIVSLFFNNAVGFKHPLHVSLTTIDLKKDKNLVEIAFKVNTNDIEYAIIRNNKSVSNIGEIKDLPEFTKYVDNYFNATFSMKINDKKSPIKFIEKKTTDNDTWLYFNITDIPKVKNLEIMNAILFDTFMDQTNLVIISFNGKERGFKTTYYDRILQINAKNF